MDTELMAATNLGDVKKLKDLQNKEEDAMAMVELAATSKEPLKEAQCSAASINPLLLASACVGHWAALNLLLEREDAHLPMVISTQEYRELLASGSSSAQGRVSARDVEEGVEHQPAASPASGALLKGVTPDGDTALHAAAGNHKGGQHFLKYAGIVYDRDRGLLFAKNLNGDTPLHCAARAGNFEMVSRLIDLAGREGADRKLTLLRMENKRQETALHDAIRIEDGRTLGHKDKVASLDADGAPEETTIVKLLMGADPQLANHPADGISPLYLAILLEKSTIALTLYDMSGGNLSYSGPDGQNALHVTVLRDTDTVIVKRLLSWNKSLAAQVDNDGNTPLHFASSMYFRTGSCLLLHPIRRPPWRRFVCCPARTTRAFGLVYEANPDALCQADKNGFFPIHVAASVGALGIIQCFLRNCPESARLRDAKGRTFLHVAVEKRRSGIVSYVCREPSLAWILNMQDNDGYTALHLAIQAKSLKMFCGLFGNLEVNLNITNNQRETPIDLSRSKLPRGMGYGMNAENSIYMALRSVRANHGAFRCDKNDEKYSRRPKTGHEHKAELDKLKDATQTFIVASVLIVTMAFSATFALPGGYRADDHTNGGTPTLAGRYIYDAFIMANTLAFVCSSVATLGFIFAAAPMINRSTRTVYLVASVPIMGSSVTCLSIAFALAVYMVLAPVARKTAIMVCVIIAPVPLCVYMYDFMTMALLARPLLIRKGLKLGMIHLLLWSGQYIGSALWPFIVSFSWAALART